jgi:four helix bundle protein
MAVGSYRELRVWQSAMELAEKVYSISAKFPRHELFGLGGQMQRCAVSVPSNIGEGHAKDSTKEYLKHVSIAMGSLAELETQLLLAGRLKYISGKVLEDLVSDLDAIGKMLRGIQKTVKSKIRG